MKTDLKRNNNMFNINGKVAVVTGASGVLGGSIAESLMRSGAKIAALGRTKENVTSRLKQLEEIGPDVIGITCDVLDVDALKKAKEEILVKWGRIDILVNCAGGNTPGGTLSDDQSIFNMKLTDWDEVVQLNTNGAVYPSLIFGEAMAKQSEGSIINVSSMAAYSVITRVPGYSVAKTAINSFTQWMAMEMAMKFSDKIRVNAIAPGFFIGNQNRNVLINPDGSLTERSKKVIAKTPMKRFGDIAELNGVVQFLCSDAASFITGAIIPVDGGFSSFSGI